MDGADRILKCASCGVEFVFSAAEQTFFASRGFMHEPKHCRNCRQKLNGGRTRVDTVVQCAKRGMNTTVPFKPKGNRPVYCRDCFVKEKQGGSAP